MERGKPSVSEAGVRLLHGKPSVSEAGMSFLRSEATRNPLYKNNGKKQELR